MTAPDEIGRLCAAHTYLARDAVSIVAAEECDVCGEERDYGPAGAATAGNNRRMHVVRYAVGDRFVTMCGASTPRRPQTTQAPLPKCGRCFG